MEKQIQPGNYFIPPHNLELYKFYSSPNIVREIKPRRMRWVGLVGTLQRQEMDTFELGNFNRNRLLSRTRHK
jgi:hypothetical protein